MKRPTMVQAFKALDAKLKEPLVLLIGGGAAMLLAHGVPLTTHDVDGLPLDSKLTPAELDPLIKGVARELGISSHWYNDYINSFTYALPKSFRERLVDVYRGKHLVVKALGIEDLLIMKCFAGREKDIGHSKALIRRGADCAFVESHIEELVEKNLPGAKKASRFLEDILTEVDNA